MDELETLANPAKDHGMLADDVARADREQCDFFFAPLPDDSFAAADHDLIEIAPQGVCSGLAKR